MNNPTPEGGIPIASGEPGVFTEVTMNVREIIGGVVGDDNLGLETRVFFEDDEGYVTPVCGFEVREDPDQADAKVIVLSRGV